MEFIQLKDLLVYPVSTSKNQQNEPYTLTLYQKQVTAVRTATIPTILAAFRPNFGSLKY